MPEEFLIPPPAEADTGKTLSALRRSREGHGAMIALFGGTEWLPTSVMRARRVRADALADRDGPAAERNYAGSLPEYNRRGIDDPAVPDSVKGMHRMNSGSLTGALSKFPYEIGRTVVLFYTEPGDTVVDPFAGHNSRMELCVRAGRDYVGCDLSAEFMAFNRRRAAELKREFPSRRVKLFHTDSRRQPVPDNTGDFTITSPPYFDLEYYGPESEQLGRSGTYGNFLDNMRDVLRENFRTLKPGAFSCWFVNDFRRDGVFYPYHCDIMRLGDEVGFVRHDIMVVDLGRGLRDGFVNEAVRCKVLPKRHEYCVVFRKPAAGETPPRPEHTRSTYHRHPGAAGQRRETREK